MKLVPYLLIAVAAFAQTPADRNTASISGIVTDASGALLAGVEVDTAPDALTPDGVKNQAPFLKTITDEQGRFSFDKTRPGLYLLIARNHGYLDQPYGGQPNLNLLGTRVEVHQGEPISDLRISMSKAGIITGLVHTAKDEPVQGTIIYAARWTYTGGIRQMEGRGTLAVTDDRGAFRIADLEPGRYVVYAIPPLASGKDSDVTDRRRVGSPTYAPNSLDLRGAVAVEISLGAEPVVNVQLREDRQFTVRGKVIGLPKGGTALATVILMDDPDTPRPGTPRSAPKALAPYNPPYSAYIRTDTEGNFQLPGLLPGAHHLYAFGGRLDLNFGPNKGISGTGDKPSSIDGDTGTADITIADHDLENVSIALIPAATITRKVEREPSATPATPPATPPTATRALISNSTPEVRLTPESGVSSGGLFPSDFLRASAGFPAPPSKDTQKISPGRYWLDVSGSVKRVLLGEVDVTHQMINITGGTADLKILLASDQVLISGTITRPNSSSASGPLTGALVSAWPVSPDLSKQTQGAVAIPTTQNASFGYALPPGDYYVAAFENLPDPGLAQYPEFLRAFTGSAMRVHIDANGSPSVNLKLIPRADTDRVIDQLR